MPLPCLRSLLLPARLGSAVLVLGCAPPADDSEPVGERLGPCVLASSPDEAELDAAYRVWKDDIITADGAGGFRRARRPDTPDGLPNSTVSEGIAYGMLLAVLMDDQPLFDDLWQYSQLWIDDHGLMMWYVDPTGTEACPGLDPALNCGAATDSDEDMAWALLLAEQRWGGQGSLGDTYGALARRQIDTIFAWEVDHGWSVLKPGDGWGGYTQTNPSYFAPAYYRVFGEVTDNVEGWNAVIDTSYQIIENSLNTDNGNVDNGLVPAWCDYEGTPRPPTPNDPTQIPRRQLAVRLRPHSVPHRAGLVLQRRAAGQGLPRQDQRVLRTDRRRCHGRRLCARRYAPAGRTLGRAKQ